MHQSTKVSYFLSYQGTVYITELGGDTMGILIDTCPYRQAAASVNVIKIDASNTPGDGENGSAAAVVQPLVMALVFVLASIV